MRGLILRNQLAKIVILLSLLIVPIFINFLHHHQTAHASTEVQVTVRVDALHVRTEGSLQGKIIGLVFKGDTFKVIKTSHNWDEVRLLNNQIGWICGDYVKITQTPIEKIVTSKVIGLNVHATASLNGHIISHLSPGHHYLFLDHKGEMIQVQSPDGPGWVTSRLVNVRQVTTASKAKNEQATQSSNNSRTLQSVRTTTLPIHSDVLIGKTIVLDPGHGGIDGGTQSVTGTYEKTLTLATAEQVQKTLEAAGAHVFMTRNSDTFVSLIDRANLSNQNNADAFISFHYNWSPFPFINGSTSFYYNKSKDELLATDVLNGVVQATGFSSRGSQFDNLSVLRNNTQPATLIELAFVSNQTDANTVESSAYRDEVAQGVYRGLIQYFSEQTNASAS